jgi:hypothetical protein
MPITSSAFPIFSCTSFKVSGPILSSLINFELIFVEGDKNGSSFSFLQADRYSLFPATFVDAAVFSPSHVLVFLSKIR